MAKLPVARLEFWAGPLDGWFNDDIIAAAIRQMPTRYRPPPLRCGHYDLVEVRDGEAPHYVYRWTEAD